MVNVVTINRPDVVALIEEAALRLTDGDKTFVIVATEGNVFRIRRVDVGPEVEGRIRVFGGITPGEKLVTEGAIFMKREIENQ